MSEKSMDPTAKSVADWWSTAITRIAPGEIDHRGVPVQDLIGSTTFPEMIWLMVRGDRPTREEAVLLEAALVASTDHGPQAPSIASARMAATCGVGLNSAVANGVNILGDVHGGAGQQCMGLLADCIHEVDEGADWDSAGRLVLERFRGHSRYVPGFGHRFHPRDPRRDPLLGLVGQARDDGVVAGRHLSAAVALESAIAATTSANVPMNIDGATAVIYGELGFEPELARGLFILSRSVGILSHAWEERQGGRRIKGPIPPSILPTYVPTEMSGD